MFGIARTVVATGLAAAVLWAAPTEARDPTALVEEVENAPGAGVDFLDYVYKGQTIDLGADGRLSLSYFETCTQETIVGGRVTVENGASKVAGGKVSVEKVACQGEQIFVMTSTSEAGATVTRMSEESEGGEKEWTVASTTPTFVLPTKAAMTITVTDLDVSPAEELWRGKVSGGKIAYPKDAPELFAGAPYRVRVTGPGAPNGGFTRLFTIDPYHDMAGTAMGRVVPLK